MIDVAHAKNFRAFWGPVLDALNQEPENAIGLVSPISNPASDDLLSLYEKEINSARQQKSKKMSPTEREEENRRVHGKMVALNDLVLAALQKAAADQPALNYRPQAELTLAQIRDNPVARVENVMHYDPSGQIGFCFGRALLIHHQLLKAGVKAQHMARIFVVGQLLLEKQLWQFHTAILVRDAKEGFVVIDPLQPKLMGYREWMTTNAAYEIKGRYSRARFYVTDPRKFLPGATRYDLKQLEHPALKEYFAALAKQMN